MNHPTSLFDSPVSEYYKPMQKHSSIHHFANSRTIPQRSCVTTRSGSARVLTSAEKLKRIDEKEKEKEERARAKQLQRRQQKSLSSKSTLSISFSENEFLKFSQRYENGYDITADERYNSWVEAYHPRSSVSTTTQQQVALSDENGKSLCMDYISLVPRLLQG